MGSVLAFDPARRRPSACVTPAYRARLDVQRTLAELEQERSEMRERLRHVVDGSELELYLLLDLVLLDGDIDALERELAPAKVVRLDGRRG